MEHEPSAVTSKADDSGITMMDVLEEEQELENNANAVLGAGDDSSCTYEKGYMKRQALYACMSCIPPSREKMAGICLGCSYHCHEGHDLIELYTKRFFKCDCGNSKFSSEKPCKLLKDKEPLNSDNKYNQNFSGLYCTCKRPYPDPEDSTHDEMIQCIICEDWYHGRHLVCDGVPEDDDYSEIICQNCTSYCDFIFHYQNLTVKTKVDVSETELTGLDEKNHEQSDDTLLPQNLETASVEAESSSKLSNSIPKSSDEKSNFDESISDCLLKNTEKLSNKGAVFLIENWRNQICTCANCKKTYDDLKVTFLLDTEDTVSHYEADSVKNKKVQIGVERELDALSTLDRVTRTEVIHEYNDLSTSLRDYLGKFAKDKEIVKEEDIKEFFQSFLANKKQKLSGGGVKHFCK